MTQPSDLAFAEMIEEVCLRYSCTPGQARREPVSTLRHMRLLAHHGPAGAAIEDPMESNLAALSEAL